MEWLLSWEVTSVVVVAVAGFGFAVLALDDFKVAKVLFLIAAADASGGVLMWGAKTQSPTWQAVLVTSIAMAAVGALTVLTLRYVDGKRQAKETKVNPGEGNVVAMTDEQFQALINRVSKMSTVPASSTPTTPPKKSEPESSQDSDLKCTFYGKDQLFYMYTNPREHAASKPSIFFGLMDLTNPYVYSTSPGQPPTAQPFPIPAKTFSEDYVRGGESQGNVEILKDFMGHIKNGDVIWGVASVTCINCIKRRSYYLYWKVGYGGWYAETDPSKLELPQPAMTPFSDSQINNYVDKMVPANKRKVMKQTFSG